MKEIVRKVSIIERVIKYVYRKWINPIKPFTNSKNYWNERYDSGGNSGDGSYNELAKFKADVLNAFISKENIKSIIEYGCGDGNQLKLAKYKKYTGFDVSKKAIQICRDLFHNDSTKSFKLVDDYNGESAQLTLSLDVIYHLIEDEVFFDYMSRLFDSSEKYVVIYSSNTNRVNELSHVKEREFSKWIEKNKVNWKLYSYIPNRYPSSKGGSVESIADFYIYTLSQENCVLQVSKEND